MKGLVERFKGDIVVVEINGKTRELSKSLFPAEIEIGDVVKIVGDKIIILKEEMDQLR
ncbi:DUF3006 domain-containing protein [Bacillus methanolicus]|uniref:DUF3006 domain-containing protein n=1 Tax=Bacillus methanolicus TaxID=1471 RepID=UPI00200BF00D|nr:DUF3006 domain-containing protein [Bacillus methanolicus]UQD51819.1 DUF3006 domain-containing protein [Bacillus methanolicus]